VLISQERKQPFGMCKPLLWSCRWREGVRSRGSGSLYYYSTCYSIPNMSYARDCLIVKLRELTDA
jgi:hypothetical protein